MRIGFIGAGKVGTSLGKLFSEVGQTIAGYYSRSNESAKAAAEFTSSTCYESIEQILHDCDTLFLTTPDGVLSSVAEELSGLAVEGKWICHCSGALESGVLSPVGRQGAKVCSVHPLLAVSDRYTSWETLKGAFFTLEGDEEVVREMESLLHSCSAKTAVISAENKPKYHLAACVVSNLAVGLADWGMTLLGQCGFTREQAGEALAPLILGNAQSICTKGTEAALTGPAERGDTQTIRKHMQCLDESDRILYALLTEKLCEIARRKYPERDDTALTSYLEGIL